MWMLEFQHRCKEGEGRSVREMATALPTGQQHQGRHSPRRMQYETVDTTCMRVSDAL